MNRKSFLLLVPALAAVFLTSTSCENANDPDKLNSIKVVANLSGREQIPANSSSATATFTGDYNKSTRVLNYSITHQGFSPTATVIHRAAQGTTGPAEFPLSTSSTSPITGTLTLSQFQENDLFAGNYYVSMSSANYPTGEIRGTIQIDRSQY